MTLKHNRSLTEILNNTKKSEILVLDDALHWLDETKKLLKPWIDFREGETGDCPEMDELLNKIVEVLGT